MHIVKLSRSHIWWYGLVCGFWVLGILTGTFYPIYVSDDVFYLVKLLPITQPSIAALIFIRLSFLVLSVFLFRNSRLLFTALILVISFSYGYILSLIMCLFGDAGWLVALLVLAPDIVLLSLFFLYAALRSINGFCSIRKNLVIPIVLICAVSMIECYYIAPFTAALF